MKWNQNLIQIGVCVYLLYYINKFINALNILEKTSCIVSFEKYNLYDLIDYKNLKQNSRLEVAISVFPHVFAFIFSNKIL